MHRHFRVRDAVLLSLAKSPRVWPCRTIASTGFGCRRRTAQPVEPRARPPLGFATIRRAASRPPMAWSGDPAQRAAGPGANRSASPPAANLTQPFGGVAQLVERLTGSQEVRGFESHRLHSKIQVRAVLFRSAWLSDHARGCVLQAAPTPTASYLMAHSADCSTIGNVPANGLAWTSDLLKACSDDRLIIEQWARAKSGGVPSLCGRCQP
jgi:hypothetical protein